MNELLTFERFKAFSKGKVDGSDSGSAYVLTLLAMNDLQLFFRGGFQPLHRSMLEELARPETDVLYAGRLEQLQIPDRPLKLNDGGGSLREYKMTFTGRGFVVATINDFLIKSKDRRRIS